MTAVYVVDPQPPPRRQYSGAVYVAYDYRDSSNIRRDEAGIPEPVDPGRAGQLLVAAQDKCDHGTRICRDARCMETWMLDHVFYWERTVAGRALRDSAPFDVLAHERDLHEEALRNRAGRPRSME